MVVNIFILLNQIPYMSLDKAFTKPSKMVCNDEATHCSFFFPFPKQLALIPFWLFYTVLKKPEFLNQ